MSDKINFDSNEFTVEGARPLSETAPKVTEFGKSGEVFDHQFWRHVLAILWTVASTHKHNVELMSYVLLRGKEAESNNKCAVVCYRIPLPAHTEREREAFNATFGEIIEFPLKINYPKETDKVPAKALTLERFKCVARL